MVPRWRFLETFLRPAFPVSRVQQEKKEERGRRKIEITGQKYNGLPYYIGRP